MLLVSCWNRRSVCILTLAASCHLHCSHLNSDSNHFCLNLVDDSSSFHSSLPVSTYFYFIFSYSFLNLWDDFPANRKKNSVFSQVLMWLINSAQVSNDPIKSNTSLPSHSLLLESLSPLFYYIFLHNHYHLYKLQDLLVCLFSVCLSFPLGARELPESKPCPILTTFLYLELTAPPRPDMESAVSLSAVMGDSPVLWSEADAISMGIPVFT